MSLGQFLYTSATWGLSPLVPVLLSLRSRRGKEDPARLNERLARDLTERPVGRLVWMHGASVGESQILLGFADQMSQLDGDMRFLFSCQTLTASRLITDRKPDGSLHQMAPVDTPAIARRFLDHWHPDLAVFAEGEIWPNLLREARRQGVPSILANARMTEKSQRSWARWPTLARNLFGGFDLILPADDKTASSMKALAGKPVQAPHNLKRGLPPPPVNSCEVQKLNRDFVAGRPCIVAASTHPGEEQLVLDAIGALNDDVVLVLVPRHPERGAEVSELLLNRGLNFSRRSLGENADAHTSVLLADTIGEMGLWFALADAVFLGGASVEGIGGHNPIEPLQLGKPVVTGPHGFNFQDLFDDLQSTDLLTIARDGDELARCLRDFADGTARLPESALASFLNEAKGPLKAAARDALALLNGRAER